MISDGNLQRLRLDYKLNILGLDKKMLEETEGGSVKRDFLLVLFFFSV